MLNKRSSAALWVIIDNRNEKTSHQGWSSLTLQLWFIQHAGYSNSLRFSTTSQKSSPMLFLFILSIINVDNAKQIKMIYKAERSEARHALWVIIDNLFILSIINVDNAKQNKSPHSPEQSEGKHRLRVIRSAAIGPHDCRADKADNCKRNDHQIMTRDC